MATGLTDEEFKPIVRGAPLVSIDIAVKNGDGQLLLGLRNNEPAKGTYFVPGGCIRKDETIADAFSRILEEETGITATIGEALFLGLFEQFYPANRFSEDGYGTHYVALTYELRFPVLPMVRTDQQHGRFRWMRHYQADAHAYTGPYFDK